ncbi:MAG: glycosyltransferase [Dysgonamonadaceae bacterium]|jgi:glycosyltransferase involved in cell wall biosynthesis|nr:glycosyltransferase [Dysgonamonadaceae bacterium]
MEQHPIVAIVMPTYNAAQYIGECIEHIISQTYTNWICYIIDNNSTDNTVSVIEKYIKDDLRFKVFRNSQTLPPMVNWNYSYSLIAGLNAKYAKLEPSDDWMFPEYIEKMVEILEQDDEIGACFSFRLDDKKVNCFGPDIYDGNIFDGKEILYAELTGKFGISGSLGTPLYRVESLKSISQTLQVLNEKNFHPDTELAHDIMQYYKVGFVFQVLSYVRRHNIEIGKTTSNTARKYNTYLNGIERTLYKRIAVFPDIPKIYKKHRLRYAWFLLKKRLINDKDCIAWHKKHLERPIKAKEYFVSPFYVLARNAYWIFLKLFPKSH